LAYYAELRVYQLSLPMLPTLLACHPSSVAPTDNPETGCELPNKEYWIKLQRIHGIPYLDMPEGFNPDMLAQTIAEFHLAALHNDKCLCHIDNQPRNILFSQNRFYLIDFSDCRFDYPERDITHLLLFWAAEMPESSFIPMATGFIDTYRQLIPLSALRWQKCLLQSISAFDSRRLKYNKHGKNPIETQTANRNLLAAVF